MYFTVDPDDVEAAAAPLSHLANAVANLDLAADLAPLALALPAAAPPPRCRSSARTGPWSSQD